MEFAIGKVESIGSYNNSVIATIQVIGLYDEQTKKVNCDKKLNERFPNRGKVFAPNFANDFPSIKQLDYIRFNFCENSRLTFEDKYDSSKDLFMIPKKTDGGQVFPFSCYPLQDNISDENLWDHQGGKYLKTFFFVRKIEDIEYICGPLKSDMTPKTGKEIKAWKKKEEDCVLTYDGECLLVSDIENRTPDFYIDCMTDKQLSEWFKKLPIPKEDVSPELQTRIKDVILNEHADPNLNASRWRRIRQYLDKISYDWNEIQRLKDIQPFQDMIQKSIDLNMDKLISGKRAEIENRKAALEQEYNQRKNELNKNIEELEKKCSEWKKLHTGLRKEKEKLESERLKVESNFRSISDKKDELIADIKLKAELGLFDKEKTVIASSWCYPLEHVNQNMPSIQADDIPENSPIAVFRDNKILKSDDIVNAVTLSRLYLGNVIYELCQPSPKWISFQEFWNESLQPIWDSAHQNPDIWHVLLIENFNIALPECWGKPLWNILSGLTAILPCAKNSQYPVNLRIIVTEAAVDSEDGSHLGLPTKIGKKKNEHGEWKWVWKTLR